MSKKLYLIIFALILICSAGLASTTQGLSVDILEIDGRITGRDYEFENKPFMHEGKVFVPLEETVGEFSRISYDNDGAALLESASRVKDLVADRVEGWISFQNGVYWSYDTVVDGVDYESAYRKHMTGINSKPISVTYDLDGKYSRYTGKLGIEDLSLVEDRPVIYRVYGDGDLLYEKVVEFGEKAEKFDIDIAGVERLKMEMSAKDDRRTGILALIEPRFIARFDAIGDTDKVVYRGSEVALGEPLVEYNGELYIAAADLAGLYGLPWAYDDSAGILYLGEDPSDNGDGEIVRMNPADYYYYSIWGSVTDPDNWDTYRVAGRFHDNTYMRFVSDAGSRLFQATWELGREYEWFSVKLGIWDNTLARNMEPVFQIVGDNEEVLYESKLRYNEPAKNVFVDVSDVEYISFRPLMDVDHFSNRLVIIDPVLKEKRAEDLPGPAPQPYLETDLMGDLEGRYVRYSAPFREPPTIKTGFGDIEARTFTFSPFKGDWEGEVVHLGEGESLFDYKKEELEGNIALIRRRWIIERRVLYAQFAGAAGVIHYNNQSGIMSAPSLGSQAAGVISIPAVAISQEDGLRMAEELESQNVAVEVEYAGSAQGNLIDCGTGLNPGDFPAEVSGNIALIEDGAMHNRRAKALLAQNAGAAGVVLYNNQPGFASSPDLGAGDIAIPFIAISREDGLDIISRLDGGDDIYATFRDAVE